MTEKKYYEFEYTKRTGIYTGLKFVQTAISSDKHRKVLHYVCVMEWEPVGQIIVGTDGQRLHWSSIKGVENGIYELAVRSKPKKAILSSIEDVGIYPAAVQVLEQDFEGAKVRFGMHMYNRIGILSGEFSALSILSEGLLIDAKLTNDLAIVGVEWQAMYSKRGEDATGITARAELEDETLIGARIMPLWIGYALSEDGSLLVK